MVRDFNDSLVSLCPECAYFKFSVAYSISSYPKCLDSCGTIATHAYKLSMDPSNFLLAYYDVVPRARTTFSDKPIWQIEVASTYQNAENKQMTEALDFAMNIANFVGYTCVQRYYFWLSYTLNPSGESLIWGTLNGDLIFPKKYFAYKHFTLAAQGESKMVTKYDLMIGVTYLLFGTLKAVFVNILSTNFIIKWDQNLSCLTSTFACTTDSYDWLHLENSSVLPAKSICSCDVIEVDFSNHHHPSQPLK